MLQPLEVRATLAKDVCTLLGYDAVPEGWRAPIERPPDWKPKGKGSRGPRVRRRGDEAVTDAP